MAKTLYDILEVSSTASPEVIKSAYRALAAKLHPDRNSSNNGDDFKLVTKAYEILSHPEKRAEYDTRLLHGEESLFLGALDLDTGKRIETVKRKDGTDTWCTIDEHVRRKGAELAETNLQGLQLSNLSLEGGILTGADLSHANLLSVNLSRANLNSVTCRSSTFRKVDFKAASFVEAVFENCVFQECSFDGCQFKSMAFRASDFRGSSLANISAGQVDFSHSILEGVLVSALPEDDYTHILRLVSFENCNFQRCNLRRTICGRHSIEISKKKSVAYLPVSFNGCDFSGANLEEACLERSFIEDCGFADACLASVNLKDCHVLRPRSFEGASLYGADFTNAVIENADFRTCNVINARFHGSQRKNTQFPDGFVPPTSKRVVEQTTSSNCFIATACCGSTSDEVRDLRHYRDAVLVHSRLGQLFVRGYYRLSPPVARFLERHPVAADCVRRSIIVPVHKIARQHYPQPTGSQER
jgi:uncharacterized protein YjbI with pentapeptide repeats